MSLSDQLTQLQTAITGVGTAVHGKDAANATAISSEATTRGNADTSEATTRANADTAEATTRAAADTALGALVGSQRGVIAIKTAAQTLPADPWGYVFQTDAANTTAALTTALPAVAAGNAGKRLEFNNTSAFNWTLTGSNILSSQSGGATSLVMAPGSTVELYFDGASYLAEGGTYQIGGDGRITVSSAAPSGGASGDTWYQV
ncbi:hypothetical protein [Burkholderia phage FLC9]|nr:hypothetical protein [Burkholderia phage FLC9]